MEELERPKRRALSDAELASELAKFPSDNIGIERAQALISEQQRLREEDSAALESWFNRMRAQDDALSRGLIRETLDELFPQAEVQQPAQLPPEPAFTSEIQVVTRRRVLTQRFKLAQFGAALNRSLMLALVSAGVGVWLGVQGLDLLVSYLVGGLFALLASSGLRSHDLHPILRSAAVFGGRGVYVFAPLVLSALALLLLTSVENDTKLGQIQLGFGYQAVVVAIAGLAALVSQILPARWHALTFGLLSSGALVSTVALGGISTALTYSGQWIWAAVAIAVLGFLLLTFSMPHLRSEPKVDLGAWLLGSLIVVPLTFVTQPIRDEWPMILILFVLVFAVAASGRDIAGGMRSRLLGLTIVFAALLSPFGDLFSSGVIAAISAAAIILLADQLIRRQPLHLASLDTSYGFYGSFQIVSWMGIVLAAFAGSEFVTAMIPVDLTPSELALLVGAAVGFLIALVRIAIIRRQDSELENIDPRNSRLENLLGL
jgi:hypothetical protein